MGFNSRFKGLKRCIIMTHNDVRGRIWRGTLSCKLLNCTLCFVTKYFDIPLLPYKISIIFLIKTLLLLIININIIMELDEIDTDFPP